LPRLDLLYNSNIPIEESVRVWGTESRNEVFKQEIEDVFLFRIFDFRNDSDVVVHLPVGSSYKRVGTSIFIR